MSDTINNTLYKHTADNLVLWTKFHNLHWHVRGKQFKPVHEMTEAYYDQLAEDYDTFAERLVQLGGKAPPSLAASLKASGVQETDKTSFTCEEVLQLVQKDFTYLAAEYKTARKAAAAEGDSTTEALYVDAIGRLEKQLWMLDATLG